MGYPAVVIVLAMFAGRMALAAAYPSGRRARREQKSSEISLEPSNDLWCSARGAHASSLRRIVAASPTRSWTTPSADDSDRACSYDLTLGD
jgi:hypothetical protein